MGDDVYCNGRFTGFGIGKHDCHGCWKWTSNCVRSHFLLSNGMQSQAAHTYIHLQFDLQWALVCSSGSGGLQGMDLQAMAMSFHHEQKHHKELHHCVQLPFRTVLASYCAFQFS